MAMACSLDERESPPSSPRASRTSRVRGVAAHLVRWGLLASVVWLLYDQHIWWQAQIRGSQQQAVDVPQIRAFYPAAAAMGAWRPEQAAQTVLDRQGDPLGYVVRTSPASDSIIGYSGPTNTLIALDTDDRILGIRIVSSGDTHDHVQAVVTDERFMTSFDGLTWEQASHRFGIQGVSGATLTSLAVAEGIVRRLGGVPHSLRFPEPIGVDEVQPFLPEARRLVEREDRPGLHRVEDAVGQPVGFAFRTSPAADDLIGFQGPTDTLVVLGPEQRVAGIAIRRSYETEDYVGWVRDEDYFMTLFNGRSLDELAALDPAQEGIEGVSGATMTSLCIARAMRAAAQQVQQAAVRPEQPPLRYTPRDAGTVLMVLLGLMMTFTSLRGRRWVRIGFQLMLIGYLGFLHGEMLSQALLVGWAQNGVAWRSAPGLVLLVVAALLVPLVSRRQFYCHHLCPHGAAQQLIKGLLPWKLHLHRRAARVLSVLPLALLGCVLAVALLRLPLNLAAIEPFDAYLFRVAGWATISIAVGGLVAALFLPMAYCRFGCPTGALLNYLRLHGKSDRFSLRDVAAVALVAMAAGLVFWSRHGGM
jgi:Na+-translocating ferredoxin:NAD+ oxidoreductase RnfG subunit